MAILINIHNLSKKFSTRPLFDKINFSISEGDRIGLIGPNGAGKSTLLKILANQESPDSGTVSKASGLKIAYLSQTPVFAKEATILSTIVEGAQHFSHDPDDWENIANAQEMISKLDLAKNKLSEDTLVETLSGGWKKKVALARELVKTPDLFLLDEPTNHLDVESILWLEELIASARFATITITHDRAFLQNVSNRILELDRRNEGGLLSVSGNYATYLDTKEKIMDIQQRREIVLKNTLRRETEWLRRGAKARTTKQQARIERAGELKQEVSELSFRNQNNIAQIEFSSAEKNKKRLLEAINISYSIGGRKLFQNVNLLLMPKMRLALLGENGCGKSTLIRTLIKQTKPDTGEVIHSDGLQIVYFDQVRETLDPDLTPMETLCPRGDHVEYQGSRLHIRGYLDQFLFTPDQMNMKVGHLSGGEQSRLLIAKLMLTPGNILILDEPTNDLDLATLTVLEECLEKFAGAIILVTHDRYFLDQVATHILAFPQDGSGKLTTYASLEQWENALNERASTRSFIKEKQVASDPKNKATSSIKKDKLGFKEKFELENMENTIHEKEAKLKLLLEQSQSKEILSDPKRLFEVTKELAQTQTEIDLLYQRWDELEQRNANC